MNRSPQRPSRGRLRASYVIFGASALLLGLGFGLLVTVSGCDEQSSTPPSGQNQGGGLANDPKSLPGRSAKTAKNVAQDVDNSQARTSAVADQMAGKSGNFEMAGLVWSVPNDWKKAPPASNFIAAEFHFGGDGGEARVTISTFPPGKGGSIDSNVERWGNQFMDESGATVVAYPKNIKVAGFPVTIVNLEGTMKGGTPGGPTADAKNYLLRGAIIEGPEGMVVVKMVGPSDTILPYAQDWDTMINGMQKKEKPR